MPEGKTVVRAHARCFTDTLEICYAYYGLSLEESSVCMLGVCVRGAPPHVSMQLR